MVKTINKKSKLKLEYDNGINEKGKKKIKTQQYSKLNVELESEDLLKFSNMVSALSDKDLLKTKLVSECELTEEV